jgi:hypothetical protein
MADEAEIGSAGASDGSGHPGGSPGEQSPLQARAQFLKNRGWDLVTGLNQGACARGGAKHGQNSESHAAVAADWEIKRQQTLSLDETITQGVILRIESDGRVAWRPDGTESELLALPESLLREKVPGE